MTNYSYSRLRTLAQCEAKYAFQYYDKWYVDEEGIEAFVGKCVHEVVEADHKGEIGGAEPWTLFRDLWAERYDKKRIVDVKDLGANHWYQYGLNCVNN